MKFLCWTFASHALSSGQPDGDDAIQLLQSRVVQRVDESLTASEEPKTTLLMKLTGESQFGFSSPYWTNTDTLNADSAIEDAIDAKYEAFNSQRITALRMCVGSANANCYTQDLPTAYSSARALFSSSYVRSSIDEVSFIKNFGPTPGSYRVCPAQQPGFNVKCPQENYARWGFCGNCPNQACIEDGGDSDFTIGIGLSGQSTSPEMGAGWTDYFASGAGTCDANSKKGQNVWLWGLSSPTTTTTTEPTTEVLLMKLTGASVFGFNSAYWSNTDTLNSHTPVDQVIDAKYDAFNSKSCRALRMCVGSANGNCYTQDLPKTYASARELFSSSFVSSSIDEVSFIKNFGPTPGSYKVCPAQQPGFNVKCPEENSARWGFCGNCPNQACGERGDSDFAIGIGLTGQSTTPEMGAGWTEYFASGAGTCAANSKKGQPVWLWCLSPETTTTTTEAPSTTPGGGSTFTTTTIPGGDTNIGGADCFGAIATFGPDFECNFKVSSFCEHDSGDGLDVSACCQDYCNSNREKTTKRKVSEREAKAAEGVRKADRRESSSKRQDAEALRKKNKKEAEWLQKRGAQETANKKAEDERKTKRGYSESKRKNERSWKGNRQAARKNAQRREAARKSERAQKGKNNNKGEGKRKEKAGKKEKRTKKKEALAKNTEKRKKINQGR